MVCFSARSFITQAVFQGISWFGGMDSGGEQQGGEKRGRDKVILFSLGNQLYGPWKWRPSLPGDPSWPICAADKPVPETLPFLPVLFTPPRQLSSAGPPLPFQHTDLVYQQFSLASVKSNWSHYILKPQMGSLLIINILLKWRSSIYPYIC